MSFYYILKKDANFSGENIEAMVAEVSNTPWNEMKCYVLHPHSRDITQVKDGKPQKSSTETTSNMTKEDSSGCAAIEEDVKQFHWTSINYIFNKKFHVSPFMGMDHLYDWTFWHLTDQRVMVSTSMMKIEQNPGKEGNDEDSRAPASIKYFNAFFDIYRTSFNPFRLYYQLVRFPVYCFIIQIWIHIEAFKLFFKGVEFIPHPDGAETLASRLIAKLMAPFFAINDWLINRGSTKDEHRKVE